MLNNCKRLANMELHFDKFASIYYERKIIEARARISSDNERELAFKINKADGFNIQCFATRNDFTFELSDFEPEEEREKYEKELKEIFLDSLQN